MADNFENRTHSDDLTEITHIRPERPAEVGVINALVMQAFADNPGDDGHQSYMVEKLRESGELTFSFVAINEGRPVGHIAVLPVEVDSSSSDATSGIYAIGPVAVLPDQQESGHGTALVNHALGALDGLGASAVVVYDDVEFFSRFGFEPADGLTYPDHDDSKLLIQARGEDELPSGTVKFPAAFAEATK